MRRTATRGLGLVIVASLVAWIGSWQPISGQDAESGSAAAGDSPIRLRIDPSPADARRITLEKGPGGDVHYRLEWSDGRVLVLEPEAFTTFLWEDAHRRSWWLRLLNISGPLGVAWVGLGLLGQLLFTGRMLVQWISSERSRRSVIPVAFWWMSLSGASLLIVYFVWRRDIVGVLGQTTGWAIYLRNLWLIRNEARALLA